MKQRLTQIQFAQAAAALSKTKEAIEQELKDKTLEQASRDRGMSKSTFRKLLQAIGIDVHTCLFPNSKKQKPTIPPLLIRDILKQLALICTSCDVEPVFIKQ